MRACDGVPLPTHQGSHLPGFKETGYRYTLQQVGFDFLVGGIGYTVAQLPFECEASQVRVGQGACGLERW